MSFLTGFGSYLPTRIVTNEELATQLEVDPAWIVQVCGIEQRRYAEDAETVVDLGVAAAEDCLGHVGMTANDIGLILVASGSPDIFCPGPASAISYRLGLDHTPAIDLPIASAGSIAALVLAESLTATFGNVLVVATEIMSRRVERTPEAKDTAILFGDGAGAAVVSPEPGATGGGRAGGFRIIHTALRTDGERARAITMKDGRFTMDGIAVIRHATQRLPAVIQEVLTASALPAAAIGTFLIHQANLKLLERVAKAIDVPGSRLFTNIQRYGNTSSASLLIAAAEWHRTAANTGEPIVLAGFGAGLTWGALLAVAEG